MHDEAFYDPAHWTELTGGFSYRFYSSPTMGARAGLFLKCPHGVVGSVAFRGSDFSRQEWHVMSFDPLSLTPSIRRRASSEDGCDGHHGYIRAGRWEDC